MLARPRTLPVGFIQPCLPIKVPKPPTGAAWLHEIKHDDGPARPHGHPPFDLLNVIAAVSERGAGFRSKTAFRCSAPSCCETHLSPGGSTVGPTPSLYLDHKDRCHL